MNEYRKLRDVLKERLKTSISSGTSTAKDLKEMSNAVRELNFLSRETSIPYNIQEVRSMLVSPFLAGLGVYGAAQLGKNLIPTSNRNVDSQLDRMIQLKPSLASIDRGLLTKYYKILTETAPEATNNPIVAASLLERVINYGGIDHTILKELADTEKSLKDKQFSQMLAVSALTRQNI